MEKEQISKKTKKNLAANAELVYGALTLSEASRATGISRPTLLAWCSDGMLRADDGTVSIRDIVAFIRERAKADKAEKAEEKFELELEKLRKQNEKLQQEIDQGRERYMLREEHLDYHKSFLVHLRDYWFSGARKYAHELLRCQNATDAQECLNKFLEYGFNGLSKQ